MTLPGSGPLSLNDIHVEINGGGASGTIIDMAYVYNNTRPGQQSYAMSNYYGKAYINKTNEGNCNNGNCVFNCNCYDFPQDCQNCYYGGGVNCTNCGGYALQNNCNDGNCSYNCATAQCIQVNCNCNCNCDCGACACQCK